MKRYVAIPVLLTALLWATSTVADPFICGGPHITETPTRGYYFGFGETCTEAQDKCAANASADPQLSADWNKCLNDPAYAGFADFRVLLGGCSGYLSTYMVPCVAWIDCLRYMVCKDITAQ